MNSKLFSFVLCTIYCIGLVSSSPVEAKNQTDAIKIVPTTIPNTGQSISISPVKYETSENRTSETKNTTVISDKTESHSSDPVSAHTEIVITTHNTTTANATNSSPANINSNKTQDNKISNNSSNPATAVTPTKAAPQSEVTTPMLPTTMTVSSTTTHTVAVLPTSKAQEKDRGFDGPSFIGGIVLALGLTGIGFVAYKFCKARTDRNYRNL